jgi:SEC-C motif-containing protein
MRSRYTAYTRREAPYLLRTWHPATRPASLALENDRTQWLGLRVLAREAGQASDARGVVEFSADFLHEGKTRSLHERSEFVRVEGAWRYLSGAQPARTATPGRNERCPCQSGKKYKHCCGA